MNGAAQSSSLIAALGVRLLVAVKRLFARHGNVSRKEYSFWENTVVKAYPLPKTGYAFKTNLGDSGIISYHQALAFTGPNSQGATLPAGLSSPQ